jgi:hypothetical protein
MITTATAQTVEMSIPQITGQPGDAVAVPVNISDTTGSEIIAIGMLIQYDPEVLSFVELDLFGTIAETWQTISNINPKDNLEELYIGMIYGSQLQPLSGSGTLINVKFQVNPTAQLGSSTEIGFDKSRTSLNEGAVGIVTSNGNLTIGTPRLPGDANGDDRVNYQDILKLIMSYNRSNGESGFEPLADFNGDGFINRDDMIVIWENYGSTR